MSIYEKEAGVKPVYMCISTCTPGGSGGMLPQKMLDFRLSETACFWCILWDFDYRLAISKGRGRDLIKGGVSAPPPK